MRLAADENFDNHLIRGLRRRVRNVDIVRVQDAGLSGRPDEEVLAWAATEGRLLLSSDTTTMTAQAYRRLAEGHPMPGLLIVPQWLDLGTALIDLELVATLSEPGDWENRVQFLPLR